MKRNRLVAARLTATIAFIVIATACSAHPASASRSITSTNPAKASVILAAHSGKRPPATLPVDWPAAVALPAGALTGSTGRSPRWSVLLVVNGSARAVQRAAIRFYSVRGWTRTSANGLHKGRYHIGLAAENRDHSALKSNLTIVLSKS